MLHKSAVVPPRNQIAEFFDFQAKAPPTPAVGLKHEVVEGQGERHRLVSQT